MTNDGREMFLQVRQKIAYLFDSLETEIKTNLRFESYSKVSVGVTQD